MTPAAVVEKATRGVFQINMSTFSAPAIIKGFFFMYFIIK